MARDFHELVRKRVNRDPEFAVGLYWNCIYLLQSKGAEDRAVGESMLVNYFDHEQTPAARQLAATAGGAEWPHTSHGPAQPA